MKNTHASGLVAQLNRLRGDLDVLARPESRAAFLRSLDDVIARLNSMRDQLTNGAVEGRLSEVQRPLEQVISFLESAKTDEVLGAFLSQALHARSTKPKRPPIEIPPDLTNQQIRDLLEQDLTRDELKRIAAQRSIGIGKGNNEELKRDILRNLERQEGYARLASPAVR